MAYRLEEIMEYLRLYEQGYRVRQIYEEYFKDNHAGISYHSFSDSLLRWRRKYIHADDTTLLRGTYPDFQAHGATVQINKSGDIVQAWIKQDHPEIDYDELIEVIKENITPIILPETHLVYSPESMLEIPLYDMHFPLSDYEDILNEIIILIDSKNYEEINLVVGQDLLHNDDFRGRTSSGRSIEKFNMVDAWNKAEYFWCNVVAHSLSHANKVNLIYSKGNHDESMSWAFVHLLAAIFPELNVDDRLSARKCIHWRNCFIGLTHGNSKKNSDSSSLRSLFTIEYPVEFSGSSVREIHAGHLHHEEAADLYGVTVRRLSSAVPTDEWSSDEGYTGAHKRFMIFEWLPGRLHAIYFV